MVTYEITDSIAVLSKKKASTVELNMVSWNGDPPRYDIRRWYEGWSERTAGKGITLTEEEARLLLEALTPRFPKDEGGEAS